MKKPCLSCILSLVALLPIAAEAQVSASYYLQQAQINQAQGEKYQQMAQGPQGQYYAAAAQAYFNAAAADRAKASQLSAAGGGAGSSGTLSAAPSSGGAGVSGLSSIGNIIPAGGRNSQGISSALNLFGTFINNAMNDDDNNSSANNDAVANQAAQQKAQADQLGAQLQQATEALQKIQQLQREKDQFGSLTRLAGGTDENSPPQSGDNFGSGDFANFYTPVHREPAPPPVNTPNNLSLDGLIDDHTGGSGTATNAAPDLSMDGLIGNTSYSLELPSGKVVMPNGTVLMPGDPGYPIHDPPTIIFPGKPAATGQHTSPGNPQPK